MQSNRDDNHYIVRNVMRDRMGGYWHPKPADGSHYANLLGLPVCAYDMYKRGAGFPGTLPEAHRTRIPGSPP